MIPETASSHNLYDVSTRSPTKADYQVAQRKMPVVCVAQSQLTPDSACLRRVVCKGVRQPHGPGQVLLRHHESLRDFLILVVDASHLEHRSAILGHSDGHYLIPPSIL